VISGTGLCEHRDACDWSNAVHDRRIGSCVRSSSARVRLAIWNFARCRRRSHGCNRSNIYRAKSWSAAKIVDILKAESLVNDGTGLLALQFVLTMLITGRTPSAIEGIGRLFFLTGGGVAIGLAIGAVIAWFERWVDDGPIEVVISILAPYAANLIGDRAHASGVLAVIACSMYMSRQSPQYMSP
jgi:Sodium/hydrogen exchanger family